MRRVRRVARVRAHGDTKFPPRACDCIRPEVPERHVCPDVLRVECESLRQAYLAVRATTAAPQVRVERSERLGPLARAFGAVLHLERVHAIAFADVLRDASAPIRSLVDARDTRAHLLVEKVDATAFGQVECLAIGIVGRTLETFAHQSGPISA